MKRFPPVKAITPERFELLVKRWLESSGQPLECFEANHLELIQGMDGEYKFDVTARFKALGGASFLVLVECKKHKNPIKRELVQTLRDKQQSVGAQKAMLVSTAPFQSGALEYAAAHNIALVQIVSGQAVYVTNSLKPESPSIPHNEEDYVGFFYGANPDGRLLFPQLLSTKMSIEMEHFLA